VAEIVCKSSRQIRNT